MGFLHMLDSWADLIDGGTVVAMRWSLAFEGCGWTDAGSSRLWWIGLERESLRKELK